MSKYDLESLLNDIKTILTNNLNTKITALNSEKNDSVTLSQVNSDAYVLQSLNGVTVNYNPFIFYGLLDVQGEGNYGYTPSMYEIIVAIVVEDEGEDVNIATRMFRYLRVLEEVFADHFDSIPEGVKISVKSQVPIEIALLNSSYPHRAVGVLLRADMG
jgi:hypothetical protein